MSSISISSPNFLKPSEEFKEKKKKKGSLKDLGEARGGLGPWRIPVELRDGMGRRFPHIG